MTISRRSFVKGVGAVGAAFAGNGFIRQVAAQSLASVRPAFSTTFRLASSPLIRDDELPGIRLRWNFPLFNPDGTFANCLPDRVRVHRKTVPLSELFFIPSADAGLDPIAVYPSWGWTILNIVQVATNPNAFEFWRPGEATPTTTQGLTFVYDGDDAYLKVFSADGQCLLISQISRGQRFYFDSAEISRFELDASSGRIGLREARCLDLALGNEIRLDQPVAELEIRQALAEQITLKQSALRLHGKAGNGGVETTMPNGMPFLDSDEWKELVDLGAELSASNCTGLPTLSSVDGMQVAKTDLFLTAASSRWEMAARLGFGFRDGPDPSASHYDDVRDPLLDLEYRNEVVWYQLEAFWGSDVQHSNIASTRLDRPFDISKPTFARYLASVNGRLDSDYISTSIATVNSAEGGIGAVQEITATTTLEWQHASRERVSGVFTSETITSPNAGSHVQIEWLQHSGVLSEGFNGNVHRRVDVAIDDQVSAEIRSFDAWDRISRELIGAAPRLVLDYRPAPPKLACATYLASLDEADGKVLVERLVTMGDFRPSCLPSTPDENGQLQEFPEWEPDELMVALMNSGYHFRLELYEARERPIEVIATITNYARDRFGGFVQFNKPLNLPDFVGGTLNAQNGRYIVRSVAGDRLYIGRFQFDAASAIENATCRITASVLNVDETDEPLLGRCSIRQDVDAEEFWKAVGTIGDIGAQPISYTFLRQPSTPRPADEADSVEYRVRIVGERNTDRIVGEFSNIVAAPRTPRRPGRPKGIQVRQLGYDYYNRLLVCCELTPEDQEGTYALQFAPGRLSPEELAAVGDAGMVFGAQPVAAKRSLFEALPVGRNFQTNRLYTIGVSRVNKAGTFGPPAIIVIDVPVE